MNSKSKITKQLKNGFFQVEVNIDLKLPKKQTTLNASNYAACIQAKHPMN